jgi:hypothetical protein
LDELPSNRVPDDVDDERNLDEQKSMSDEQKSMSDEQKSMSNIAEFPEDSIEFVPEDNNNIVNVVPGKNHLPENHIREQEDLGSNDEDTIVEDNVVQDGSQGMYQEQGNAQGTAFGNEIGKRGLHLVRGKNQRDDEIQQYPDNPDEPRYKRQRQESDSD